MIVEKLRNWEKVYPEDEDKPDGSLYHEAADRIEELEEKLMENPCKELWYEERIKELEVKLAKTLDVIDWALICWDDHNKCGYDMQGDWVYDARSILTKEISDE